MSSLTLQSPAKVNLFLRVTGKRPDGYHNIVTLFERISLCDTISLTATAKNKIQIQCAHPHVPQGRKNLVYKAAEMLKDDFGIRQGVKIFIHKRIPVAAGLAGGSSNAATALKGLNQLWRLRLSKNQLLSYARKLGSDVAFFLYDCPWALGTERGDHIRPLRLKTQLWHIVVTPKVKIYSRTVYERLKLKLTKKNDDVNILIQSLRKNDIFQVGQVIQNDLEATILRLSPSLATLKKRLNSLKSQGVMISGSGPSVFGLLLTQSEGQKLKRLLMRSFSQVFVVRTL